MVCFDWDLTYWQQPVVFNLELMKLSNYHKQQRNIVKMLNEYDQSRYSKIIVSKDYLDDYFPSEIFNNPKSECGGIVFSDGVYQPMDLKIEKLPADTSIYEKMGRFYQCDEGSKYRFNSMLKSPHLRLSLDGSTIWSDWEKQLAAAVPGKTFSLIIHDKNLVKVDGAISVIDESLKHFNSQGRRLGFKYPLDIYTDEDFLNWGRTRKLKDMSKMKLHKFFDDALFIEAIAVGTGLSCEYLLSADMCTNEGLLKIFKQTIFLREHNSRILLTLREENLVSPELKLVIQLINEYSAYTYKYRKDVTIYEYAKRFSRWLKVDLLNTFNFLRENNYPLFKLFYECLSIEIKEDRFETRWVWKSNGGSIYDRR